MTTISRSIQSVHVRAFAKVNLRLNILGVRRDGYHEIETVLQSLGLSDTLTFRHVPGPFEITCSDPRCPCDEANIVWKAAEVLWRLGGRSGAPRDLRVRITKRIPMQAGLGGGSSDAAAAMKALAAVWRMRLDPKVLRRAGARVGADVPFFFVGGTALGTGRGDHLKPLPDAPPAWVVVAIPGFGVSTKDAYGWWDQGAGEAGEVGRAGRVGSVGRAADQVGRCFNAFEPLVVARHPEIGRLASAFHRHGARDAAMAGSGSAVFGLFDLRAAAERAAEALGGRCRTLLTRTLNRRRYEVLSAPVPNAG